MVEVAGQTCSIHEKNILLRILKFIHKKFIQDAQKLVTFQSITLMAGIFITHCFCHLGA